MRYFETRKARIEIIPMIDIMFFLLVFFIMFTLHMIPSRGLSSALATSSTAQNLPHPTLVIAVDGHGQMFVDDQPVSAAALTERLRHSGHAAETVVTIAAEHDLALQSLMRVMDACRLAGVTQIGIASRENQP